MSGVADRASFVVLTFNRKAEVLRTLARLEALPQRLPTYIVDNDSVDGTATAIHERFPEMRVVRLNRNLGAAGRNAGVAAASTPYVAFCDDDTWWAAGAVERAAAILDAHPRLAAVTARVLVGPENRDDPTNALMAKSPLANELGVPGTLVFGLMAGACMMRRCAFLAAGGYEPRLFIGGEEGLLALDLAAAGWSMAFVPEVIIHHHPSALRDSRTRRRMLQRNALWCAWLRRSWRGALRESLKLARASVHDGALALGGLDAVAGLPWILARRKAVPPAVEATLDRVRACCAEAERPSRLSNFRDSRLAP